MQSFRNDVHNLSNNTHVQSNTCREFYHDIVYMANGGRILEFNTRRV